jgi:hypothetical protein
MVEAFSPEELQEITVMIQIAVMIIPPTIIPLDRRNDIEISSANKV